MYVFEQHEYLVSRHLIWAVLCSLLYHQEGSLKSIYLKVTLLRCLSLEYYLRCFCPKILGRWQGTKNDILPIFERSLSILYIADGGEPYCYNQISLNFLHSRDCGDAKTLLSHLRAPTSQLVKLSLPNLLSYRIQVAESQFLGGFRRDFRPLSSLHQSVTDPHICTYKTLQRFKDEKCYILKNWCWRKH